MTGPAPFIAWELIQNLRSNETIEVLGYWLYLVCFAHSLKIVVRVRDTAESSCSDLHNTSIAVLAEYQRNRNNEHDELDAIPQFEQSIYIYLNYVKIQYFPSRVSSYLSTRISRPSLSSAAIRTNWSRARSTLDQSAARTEKGREEQINIWWNTTKVLNKTFALTCSLSFDLGNWLFAWWKVVLALHLLSWHNSLKKLSKQETSTLI